MTETCHTCGAGLYEGQQFCRRCGTPVGAVAAQGGEAPTQLLPEGAQAAPVTSPQARVETGPVGGQQPTAYHAPAAFNQTSPLVGHPYGSQPLAVERPARRRGGAWLFALLAVFVLGAGLAAGGAFILWRTSRHRSVVPVARTGPRGVPAAPAAPEAPSGLEGLGARIKDALKGVPLPLDESGAVVSGDTTTLTRTYELGEDASFALSAFKGDVKVTGVDGDSVTVKIVKSGGSASERGAARVLEAKSDEGLALMTMPNRAGGVSISYEVSVPRGMRQLEITVDRGDVRVAGFAGAVTADVKQGAVEFREVSGEVRSKLIKGNTRVFQSGVEREGSQQFSVVKGDIEATFAEGSGADIKAETLSGDIEVADAFGLRPEKSPAGRHLAGRIGEGGEALVFKVNDGDIKLKK